MLGALVNVIIWILILGCIYAVADYAIANLLPDPPARVLRVVLIVLIGIIAILLLLSLIGGGAGFNLPRVTVQ